MLSRARLRRHLYNHRTVGTIQREVDERGKRNAVSRPIHRERRSGDCHLDVRSQQHPSRLQRAFRHFYIVIANCPLSDRARKNHPCIHSLQTRHRLTQEPLVEGRAGLAARREQNIDSWRGSAGAVERRDLAEVAA